MLEHHEEGKAMVCGSTGLTTVAGQHSIHGGENREEAGKVHWDLEAEALGATTVPGTPFGPGEVWG